MTPPDAAILTGTHVLEIVLRHGEVRPSEIVVVRGGSTRGLARLVRLAEETGVPVRWVDREAMQKLTGDRPVEVAAACGDRRSFEVAEVLSDRSAAVLAVALEGVSDPHNLGEILRSALAADVRLAILEKQAEAMPRDVLARSSAGASECLPLVFADDIAEELDALHAAALTTVAAVPAGGENLFETELPARTALVVGGERRGLSKQVLDKCRRRVTIPTSSRVQSLSAAASAAVMLFEAVRRRGGPNPPPAP